MERKLVSGFKVRAREKRVPMFHYTELSCLIPNSPKREDSGLVTEGMDDLRTLW